LIPLHDRQVEHHVSKEIGHVDMTPKLTSSHIDTAWLWRYTQTQQKVSTKRPTLSYHPALPGSSGIFDGLPASLTPDRPKLDNPM